MFRREIFDYLQPGEDLVEEPFQRADRPRPAAGLPPRGLLGAHGHAQGQAAAREPARERAKRPGSCGSPTAPPPPDWRFVASALMLPLTLGAPPERRRRVLAIGAHPDDIEIGCGGTLLQLIERGGGRDVRWVVLSGERERADEARRSAEAMLEGVPARRGRSSATSATASSPTRARIKDFFEELKARRHAGHRPHSPARRPAPGSSAHLRAHLEHVPRPSDPRVRDPQVRRRHGRPRTSFVPTRRAALRGARSTT